MSEEMKQIPDEMLSDVTGGRLVKGWGNELRRYMKQYKDRGYSCGRFMQIIKGTPDIFGASNRRELQKVLDWVDNNWDSI